MEDERMEQNRQPEKTDVVFFSPEMLRLADQHRREQQERLENCRQAARNGDCAQRCRWDFTIFMAPAV